MKVSIGSLRLLNFDDNNPFNTEYVFALKKINTYINTIYYIFTTLVIIIILIHILVKRFFIVLNNSFLKQEI
jgi:hypothetical protein